MELVAYFLFVKNKLQIITRKCIFNSHFGPNSLLLPRDGFNMKEF